MRSDGERRLARLARGEADQLEQQLIDAVVDQLRPALEAAFRDLQSRVETLVGDAVGRQLAQTLRSRRIGEAKRCSVCGLAGARNLAGLKAGHSQQDHQHLRLKQPTRTRPESAPERDPLRIVG
jgi:hypothetical protein